MKKFIAKIALLFAFAAVYLCARFFPAYHYDTFNVFHWKDIRFIEAEPNKNYIKTKYILKNPNKFNAFVFGSSRAQNLPKDGLPKTLGGKETRWYNMSSSVATPHDHLLTLQTFVKNGIQIAAVVVPFDEIMMFRSEENQRNDLMRCPYQEITAHPLKYLQAYLLLKPEPSIVKSVKAYKPLDHQAESEFFYEYGGNSYDPALADEVDLERYKVGKFGYSQKGSYKDLEAIFELCAKNKIELFLFANPTYKSAFLSAVDDGYFDLLRAVAKKCEFYNFSGLNDYTTDPRYYYEWSHYRPVLGLAVEKVLFGSEEEREQARRTAGDKLFGVKVNSNNVEEIIAALSHKAFSIE